MLTIIFRSIRLERFVLAGIENGGSRSDAI
jgi:hypothetical protein